MPKATEDSTELRVFNDPRRFAVLPIADLEVDPGEQRRTPPEKVDRMAAEFNPALLEVITVAEFADRPGKYRVTEGQTRTLMMKKLFPDGEVMCAILPPTTTASERSQIALDISTSRRAFSALDKWHQKVRSNMPFEIAAERVFSQFGLRVGQSASASTVACPGTLTSLIHGGRREPEDSAEILHDTLLVLTEAYPEHDRDSKQTRFDRDLLHGVFEIIARNPNKVDLKRLATRIRQRSADLWVRDAADPRRKKYAVIGESVVREYNSRLSEGRKLTWSR